MLTGKARKIWRKRTEVSRYPVIGLPVPPAVFRADRRFRAFEFKWGKGGIQTSVRNRFLLDYPDTEFNLINQDNYFEVYR
jgi:hypothetical protein